MFDKLQANMGSKTCEVTLTADSLRVDYLKSSGKPVHIHVPYTDLLKVETRHQCSCCSAHVTATTPASNTCSTTVHYVRHVTKRRLRMASLRLQCDVTTCHLLSDRLQQQLNKLERPKRVVVLINPNSGKRQAEKIFTNKVQPVFTLCGIHTSVFVTRAPREASRLLQTVDLSDVHGVVAVGGDGLYCEVMNGLLLRTHKGLGVNPDDPEVKVSPAFLPIGIIPAGSGDWVVQYTHGTRDVMTAAMRVVLGVTSQTNVVSVHEGRRLAAYSGLVLGFGLQGDIMHDCDKFRWMGPKRYNVIPISTVLNRRTFDVEIEYEDDVTGEVKRMSDRMYSVDTYVISKGGNRERLAPVFGDSALSVYTSSKCSLAEHVQQLAKLKDNMAGCFDHDFVTTFKTQNFTVSMPHAPLTCTNGHKVLKDKCYINCDGEVLRMTGPEFQVRLHRHVIRLYGDAENQVDFGS